MNLKGMEIKVIKVASEEHLMTITEYLSLKRKIGKRRLEQIMKDNYEVLTLADPSRDTIILTTDDELYTLYNDWLGILDDLEIESPTVEKIRDEHSLVWNKIEKKRYMLEDFEKEALRIIGEEENGE